jgi:Bacterial SCP ortholog
VNKDPQITAAVKEILDLIKNISPGKSVELRVPPYGVIQCIAGSNHRRGTPPNTVEMSGQTLIRLIKEPSLWGSLCESGEVRASGLLSDLSNIFTQAAVKYRA